MDLASILERDKLDTSLRGLASRPELDSNPAIQQAYLEDVARRSAREPSRFEEVMPNLAAFLKRSAGAVAGLASKRGIGIGRAMQERPYLATGDITGGRPKTDITPNTENWAPFAESSRGLTTRHGPRIKTTEDIEFDFDPVAIAATRKDRPFQPYLGPEKPANTNNPSNLSSPPRYEMPRFFDDTPSKNPPGLANPELFKKLEAFAPKDKSPLSDAKKYKQAADWQRGLRELEALSPVELRDSLYRWRQHSKNPMTDKIGTYLQDKIKAAEEILRKKLGGFRVIESDKPPKGPYSTD